MQRVPKPGLSISAESNFWVLASSGASLLLENVSKSVLKSSSYNKKFCIILIRMFIRIVRILIRMFFSLNILAVIIFLYLILQITKGLLFIHIMITWSLYYTITYNHHKGLYMLVRWLSQSLQSTSTLVNTYILVQF